MKKSMILLGMVGFLFWGNVQAGPPCEKKALQDSCVAECESDSTLSWCGTICTEDPTGSYAWCDSGTAEAASAESVAFSCDTKDSYTYVAVGSASDTQAEMIMNMHCADTTSDNIQVMFADLTQQDVEGVICHYDTSASYCN